MPSPTELLIILGIILLLFGARKLPELARSLGKSTKEFKAGLKESADEEEKEPPDSATPEVTSSEQPSRPSPPSHPV
jgi:sec-independent protein translocase protein TatA